MHGSVLVIDDDLDIAELVREILTDEGYGVTVLPDLSSNAIAAEVGRIEPDVVLLDGADQHLEYGTSWGEAATLSRRDRRIPVVMFSAHPDDVREAIKAESERSKDAAFAAIVGKPFEIDELLVAVARAAASNDRF